MTNEIEFAASFARAVVDGDLDAALEMLSDDCRAAVSASDLSTQLDSLADEMGGITGVGEPMVMLEEWPGMSPTDRAMVYVPLEGDVYSEAITVTISGDDDAMCIAGIEWERP